MNYSCSKTETEIYKREGENISKASLASSLFSPSSSVQTILEEGQKVNLSDAIHHSQFLWKLKADTSEHNEMTREDFFYEQVSLLFKE